MSMFHNLRPLGDRVLIKRLETDERTAGGIFIPDAAKEKAQMGEVVAVGNGRKDNNGAPIALAVKVGDKVFFGKYAGTQADDEYIIMREEELLGVIEK